MQQRFFIVLFLIFGAAFFKGNAWAWDYESDFHAETEAKKDMMAYVQSTFPLRFGNNLQMGDLVQYEIQDSHSSAIEPYLNKLEVINKQDDKVTIKEEFEGNILFYKIDLDSNTLLEYWGYDEDGTEHRPIFISANEVESRMNSMLTPDHEASAPNIPAEFTKPRFTSLPQSESISIGRSTLTCEVKALDVPNIEGITPELRSAIQELSKVLVSDSVPKMLPAKLMASYLDNPELFEDSKGLVKEKSYQLLIYSKSNH